MDLSFSLPSSVDATPVAAADLARLTAALASPPPPAAVAPATGAGPLLAPSDGAFSATMAASLARWGRE